MSSHTHSFKVIQKSFQIWPKVLFLLGSLQIIAWYIALFKVGSDTDQGNVYRIIFVHVPVAWCAFFWVFMGALFGIITLTKNVKAVSFDLSSHASIEVGMFFSLLMLVTGSIWGRPTWGIWWDFDPRLTSSLVMFLLCCGYLVIRHFTPDEKTKRNVSAIVSILCAINVPVVYYSVNLWRSVHQPQTFFEKTQYASSDINYVLFFNFITMFLLSIAVYKVRRFSISAKQTLESARSNT